MIQAGSSDCPRILQMVEWKLVVAMQTFDQVFYHEWRGGKWQKVEGGVITERPVSITVNGEVWLTLMCTPTNLEALAVGFLYNESFIHSTDEIVSVRVCPNEDNVDVWLHHSIERPKHWRRTTGCTGGVTSIEEGTGEERDGKVGDHASHPIAQADGVVITPAQIQHLSIQLFDSQDLYKQVGGVHNSALSDGQKILASAEDIGRHNTLDKIAGRCLLDNIHPEHAILLTTGRISSDMLQKALRIGASVLISRTSPTSLSVEMADQFGVTLIGYARRDRFTAYTHPERIAPLLEDTIYFLANEKKED